MRNVWSFLDKKKWIFACMGGICLLLVQSLYDADDAKWANNRILQINGFCEGVVKPFLLAFKNKFPDGIDTNDYFDSTSTLVTKGENQTNGTSDNDHTDDDTNDSPEVNFTSRVYDDRSKNSRISFTCDFPDYREFSFPVAEELDVVELQAFLHGYTYCEAINGNYGSDFDTSVQDGSDLDVWPKDLQVIIHSDAEKYLSASCCSNSDICQDIEENFNYNSSCFLDANEFLLTTDISAELDDAYDSLVPVLCANTRSLTFGLTQKGASVGPQEHRRIIEKFLECSASYDDFHLPSFAVKIEKETNTLNVTCFTCDIFYETYTACEELQDDFVTYNLCFPSDQQEYYILDVVDVEEDFVKCNTQNESNYTQTLVLPQEYIKDTTQAKIEESLYEFLQCRLEMGAYGILGAEDLPEFEFVSAETHNVTFDWWTGYTVVADVTIRCNDKCSNGAFCRDIETHYNGELTCVTMHHCSFSYLAQWWGSWWNFDSIQIDYTLESITGGKFESYSDQYKKDLESRLLRNLEDYIECRFKDDPRDQSNSWRYYVFGWISGDKYTLICDSECDTIPYCDALRIRRKEDPKDDLCFEKWIGVGEDERVNVNYDYQLNYEANNVGAPQSFSYSVQTVAGNPIHREYYGHLMQPSTTELDTDQKEEQKKSLKDLMIGFGLLDETDVSANNAALNNLCNDLDEHVTCDVSKRIVKIDMEIPNGGFKAPTIKTDFGDQLKELTLGVNVDDPFDFPGNHFFNMTKLRSLILRARGKMQGSLDSKIGEMSNLAYLDLNQCPMLENDHKGITGAIPTEIESISLMVLDMGCNKLSGKIPDAFYDGEVPEEFYEDKDDDYPRAKKIYSKIILNDNNLQRTISDDIDQFYHLNQLSLARNKFSGIFPHMKKLNNLQFLDLQGNRDVTNCTNSTGNKGFTGDIPKIVKQLDNKLEVLSLNDNCFNGKLYNKMRNLKKVKYLNLKNNDLTGEIPPQLIELESLKYLFLQGNPRLDKTVTPELKTFLEENGVDHDLY